MFGNICFQTILLFCTASAIASILDRSRECPSDAVFSKASTDAFESLGKRANVHITKQEFIPWAMAKLDGADKLDAVFRVLVEFPAA